LHANDFLQLAQQAGSEAKARATRLLERHLADSGNFAPGHSLVDRPWRHGEYGADETGVVAAVVDHQPVRAGIGWMEQVLARVSELALDTVANANLVLGMLAFGHGDYARAAPALRAASAIFTNGSAIGGEPPRRRFLRGSSLLPLTQPQGRQSSPRPSPSSASCKTRGESALGCSPSAEHCLLSGQYAQAASVLEDSARIARANELEVFHSNALVNLGLAYLELDRLREAASALCEALNTGTTKDNRETIARSLEGLAAPLYPQTSPGLARPCSVQPKVFDTPSAPRLGRRPDSSNRTLQSLRAALGDEHTQQLIQETAALPVNRLLNYDELTTSAPLNAR
jgi:hypothetical protein